MEVYLGTRASRQIRLAAEEAIEEGDTETLREEILESFTEEQVEEIERRLETGDFYEFLSGILDEWDGDDVEELFELLETQLAESGIDLKAETDGPTEAADADDEEGGDGIDDDEMDTVGGDEEDDEEAGT